MKTKHFSFIMVIITVFVTMFITACRNLFIHDDGLPGTPKNIKAEEVSSNSITISWSPESRAERYYVYRSSDSEIFNQIGETTDASYKDTGLTAGMTYYYQVAAHNEAGTGFRSRVFLAATVLNEPAGVTAKVATLSSITVSWSSVTNATGYYVYRSSSSSGEYTQAGSVTTTSYTDTGLSENTAYYYKVAAFNDGGTGDQSSAVSAKTSEPGTPTGVTATATSSSSIRINWSSAANATGYYVYRSSSSSGTYTQVGYNVTTTSFTNTGLSGSTTYYYKVAAYNGALISPQSSDVSATTSVPITITISGTARTGYTLTASTTGSGWTGEYIWMHHTSITSTTSWTGFSTGLSGTNYNTLTIPSGYTGRYIRVMRAHPNGTWTYNGSGSYIASDVIGPVTN